MTRAPRGPEDSSWSKNLRCGVHCLQQATRPRSSIRAWAGAILVVSQLGMNECRQSTTQDAATTADGSLSMGLYALTGEEAVERQISALTF